jgi:subtilisin family serine protease
LNNKLLIFLLLVANTSFAYEVEKVYTPYNKEQNIKEKNIKEQNIKEQNIKEPSFEFKTDEEKALNQKKMNSFVIRSEAKKNKKISTNIYSLQENERKEIGLFMPFNEIQDSLFILRNLNLTGKKVNIAVVDNGISDFDKSINLVKNDSCIYGYDAKEGFYKQPSDTNDFYGHGSNMITIIGHKITGIAPDSKIMSIRIANNEERKSGSVLKGLTCATNLSPDIINLSQGGWEKNTFIKNPTMDKKEEHYKDVYKDIINKDILLVASMKNRVDNFSKYMNTEEQVYQSSLFNIKDIDKQVLIVKSFSKKSKTTSFAGDNKEITNRVLSVPINFWYAWCGKENIMSNLCLSRAGNSAATAVISGIAALVKESNPKLKGREIAEILLKTASREMPEYTQNTCGEKGNINCGDFTYGAGVVDPIAAIRMAKSKYKN